MPCVGASLSLQGGYPPAMNAHGFTNTIKMRLLFSAFFGRCSRGSNDITYSLVLLPMRNLAFTRAVANLLASGAALTALLSADGASFL